MSQIEAGLLEQARSGNRDAFDLLVGPLIEPAYRLAFGMLHDREAAEDAVQEATFKAWTRLENVRPGWSIRPWFFGIVANQCRTIRRGRWWSVVKIAAPWLAMPSPEDQVVRGADVRRALRALPADRLLVLVLHYYLDLSMEEVAAIVGAPVGTVKSRMHRAFAQLRPLVDQVHEVMG
ncbi:MAG: RNA polymerase sigma factor [Chloroflexi bacterium]|nr:MAG: RNA polymerase sigma factor [Chloroflexota bacterium]